MNTRENHWHHPSTCKSQRSRDTSPQQQYSAQTVWREACRCRSSSRCRGGRCGLFLLLCRSSFSCLIQDKNGLSCGADEHFHSMMRKAVSGYPKTKQTHSLDHHDHEVFMRDVVFLQRGIILKHLHAILPQCQQQGSFQVRSDKLQSEAYPPSPGR